MQNQNLPQINLDISNYKQKREAGIITPAKVGASYIVAIKRWRSDNGAEDEPQVVPINIKGLEEAKKNLQSQINGINEFIEDLEKL